MVLEVGTTVRRVDKREDREDVDIWVVPSCEIRPFIEPTLQGPQVTWEVEYSQMGGCLILQRAPLRIVENVRITKLGLSFINFGKHMPHAQVELPDTLREN